MDGDRPVVDGRDIFESKLQGLIREVFEEGWEFGCDGLPNTECGYAESEEAHARHDKKLHELLISYLDGPASDVGAQDETSEEGEMGDGVRQEDHIKEFWEGFAKGIYDESAALRANGALQRAAEQIKGIYKTPGR